MTVFLETTSFLFATAKLTTLAELATATATAAAAAATTTTRATNNKAVKNNLTKKTTPAPFQYSQVAQLVRRHDDTRESSRVLHYCDRVDLLQSLVHHACAAHVGEPGGPAVALANAGLAAAHVKSGKRIY